MLLLHDTFNFYNFISLPIAGRFLLIVSLSIFFLCHYLFVVAFSCLSFSQKHRRCLGSRLGDYGRSERECPDPVDGQWTGCGRAGAAEIAWEEARDGGARANVRIR